MEVEELRMTGRPRRVRYCPVPGPGNASDSFAAVDVAVVGAGAAGLYTALVAAEQRRPRAASCPARRCRSPRATGRRAAWPPRSTRTTAPRCISRTRCGRAAATRARAAPRLCEEAPERVRELEERGIEFDRYAGGELMLSLEGGHTRRRVVHAGGSATGRHLTTALSALVHSHERIEVRERSSALRLWVEDGRCVGALTDGNNAAWYVYSFTLLALKRVRP